MLASSLAANIVWLCVCVCEGCDLICILEKYFLLLWVPWIRKGVRMGAGRRVERQLKKMRWSKVTEGCRGVLLHLGVGTVGEGVWNEQLGGGWPIHWGGEHGGKSTLGLGWGKWGWGQLGKWCGWVPLAHPNRHVSYEVTSNDSELRENLSLYFWSIALLDIGILVNSEFLKAFQICHPAI